MPRAFGIYILVLTITAAAVPRSFNTVTPLETTSESSANVSMGDLDNDGDFDLVLAKGRHTPLVDRVLLNDGKGGFVASDLGPTADRTYTAALVDVDGDRDLDVLTSNDRAVSTSMTARPDSQEPRLSVRRMLLHASAPLQISTETAPLILSLAMKLQLP